MKLYLQVKGDNYKRSDDGTYTFEIGCDLFVATGRGNTYKIMDEWWLIDALEVIKELCEPVVEKVSANRVKYHFKIE